MSLPRVKVIVNRKNKIEFKKQLNFYTTKLYVITNKTYSVVKYTIVYLNLFMEDIMSNIVFSLHFFFYLKAKNSVSQLFKSMLESLINACILFIYWLNQHYSYKINKSNKWWKKPITILDYKKRLILLSRYGIKLKWRRPPIVMYIYLNNLYIVNY